MWYKGTRAKIIGAGLALLILVSMALAACAGPAGPTGPAGPAGAAGAAGAPGKAAMAPIARLVINPNKIDGFGGRGVPQQYMNVAGSGFTPGDMIDITIPKSFNPSPGTNQELVDQSVPIYLGIKANDTGAFAQQIVVGGFMDIQFTQEGVYTVVAQDEHGMKALATFIVDIPAAE
ncbi:MAG: hypothetical protein ABH839_02905 [Chloroflexota bacterium]